MSEEVTTTAPSSTRLTALPFPSIKTEHILNCSFHTWYPLFRAHTPKARLIPLPDAFLSYLRADGIILPPDTPTTTTTDTDSGYSDSDDPEDDPSEQWRPTHDQIFTTISQLGGRVTPKLNWSAPKDATWINPTHSMECRSPNEIYLLLKSSDFITHDLEHAFEGCVDVDDGATAPKIPYHLTLRKSFNLNPSLEFRVFVRRRQVIGVCQRDLNHFPFLFDLRSLLLRRIQSFFETVVRPNFPEENYAFDVYVPPPHERVWLIDINPWAVRTDPLLFSWLELLTLDTDAGEGESEESEESEESGEENLEDIDDGDAGGKKQRPRVVRFAIQPSTTTDGPPRHDDAVPIPTPSADDSPEDIIPFTPEFRLVSRDDPEAYQFATTKYSAHKLPRDVVDAGMTPEGMAGMMAEWKRAMEGTLGGESSEDERLG